MSIFNTAQQILRIQENPLMQVKKKNWQINKKALKADFSDTDWYLYLQVFLIIKKKC